MISKFLLFLKMNLSVPIKMMLLTTRQFIEWSPATIAAMLSAGKLIPHQSLIKYLRCRLFINDESVYMEKIKILQAFADKDYNWCIAAYADRFLPNWMFRCLVDSIVVTESIFDFVYDVENILYLLMTLPGDKIRWNYVRPRSRIRELLPWYKHTTGGSFVNDAIMGCGGLCDIYSKKSCDIYSKKCCYSFSKFKKVIDILKYGDGSISGIWLPQGISDFCGFNDRYLEKMLITGWIIIMNIHNPRDYGAAETFIEFIGARIIKHGLCYFLFDKKFIYGEINRKAYGVDKTIEDRIEKDKTIEEMIEKDKKANPAKYELWLMAIKSRGFYVESV